jgi:signal peptidase
MVIVIVGVAGFWFGLRLALRTDYPILAVASESMEPVLYRGDLIIVQGVINASDIKVGYLDAPEPGDIIIFQEWTWNDGDLIVHRAVKKIPQSDGSLHFKTRGDRNWYPGDTSTDPWEVKESDIVGRYVGKVSWLGYVPLFMREVAFPFLSTPLGFVAVILIIIGLILLDYFPLRKKQVEAEA